MEVAPAAGPMPGKGQADSAEKAAAGDLARPAAARLSATTSPSDWLAAIERLAAAGDEVDARAEFAAFRKAYPDYPVHDRLEKMLAP